MTGEEELRLEVDCSIEYLECALRRDDPREVLECLLVQAQFADAFLVFQAGDAARLEAALDAMRCWADGRRELPPIRASQLAAAIVSLDPDAATWWGSHPHWTGSMQEALRDGLFILPVESNQPVSIPAHGADKAAAERKIAWLLGQLGVPA